MTAIDELLANNRYYVTNYPGPMAGRPARGVAVVACMDARLDVYAMLGLAPGETHVIRNAGGAVTEDALRSLTVSQRELGTTEIMLIHHSQCGMQTFTDDHFKAEVLAETGIRPPWAMEAFTDAEADVRQSIARIKACPFLPHRGQVRGFIFEVENGRLSEVETLPGVIAPGAAAAAM